MVGVASGDDPQFGTTARKQLHRHQDLMWCLCRWKKGVPNRSDILFALWKAGYQVDVDAPEYSEGVRSRFYSLMGAYLSRLEFEGDVYSEMSSSEGSGGQFDTTNAE